MAEFVSYNRRRLIGVALIPMDNTNWAIEELHRSIRKGHRAVMINLQPPQGCPPYRNQSYNSFWAVAQEAGVPVILHVATGRNPTVISGALGAGSSWDPADAPTLLINSRTEIMYVLGSDFIFGQILDRFPTLKVVDMEFEVSWIPWYSARLDQLQEALAGRLGVVQLPMKPSEYVTRHIWHGWIDDPYVPNIVELIGSERILWGSDFPHVRSIGLDTLDRLAILTQGLRESEAGKVVGGNAAQLFGVPD